MTTIAYRDGVLAGDQRTTDDGAIVPGRFIKVFKNDQGWLYGACGDSGPMEDFYRFMAGVVNSIDPKRIPRSGIYEAIIVSPTSDVFVVEKGFIEKYPLDTEYLAIGSGRKVAYGALYMGATPAQAVQAAITHDNCTGGSVNVVLLNKLEKTE